MEPVPTGFPLRPMVTSGWFVRRDDAERSIILRDRHNNWWPLDQVSILMGSWGFDDEGFSKLPRPAEYNPDGKERIRGDRCLILFLEGSRKRPVAMAGFRSLAGADFMPYSYRKPLGADWNRLAARVQPRDAAGVPVGSIDIEAGADGKATLYVTVGPPDGKGPRVGVVMDATDNSILILGNNNSSVGLTPQGTFEIIGSSGLGVHPLVQQGSAAAGFYFDLAAALTALGALIGGANPATSMGTKLTAELGAPGSTPGYSSAAGRTD